MWIAQCNICRKNLQNIGPNDPHFCPQCGPHAEAWNDGLRKIAAELTALENSRVNKFRDLFLREVVVPKKQELKAV